MADSTIIPPNIVPTPYIPVSTVTSTIGSVSSVISTPLGGASTVTAFKTDISNVVSGLGNYVSTVKSALTTELGLSNPLIPGLGVGKKTIDIPGVNSNGLGTVAKIPSLSPTGYEAIMYPPQSLGSDQYPYYTIIYINDVNKSEEVTVPANTNGNTAGSSIPQALTKSGALPTNNQTNSTTIGGSVMGSVQDALNGGVNALVGVTKEWSSTKKRLKVCIGLPMPQKVRANYSAGYTATEAMGAFGAVITSALDGNMKDSAKTLALAAAPTIAGTAMAGAKTLLGKAGGILPDASTTEKIVGQLASKLSGRVFNRRQEQLFENMEFRNHALSWLFIPRNIDESVSIMNIIQLLKEYMHPDLNDGSGSSLLIVPAEFDIDYMWLGDRNFAIPRVATCALISIDVNYTAIGEFVAFADTPYPVAIQLDCVFREMEPLNRTMIQNGF